MFHNMFRVIIVPEEVVKLLGNETTVESLIKRFTVKLF